MTEHFLPTQTKAAEKTAALQNLSELVERHLGFRAQPFRTGLRIRTLTNPRKTIVLRVDLSSKILRARIVCLRFSVPGLLLFACAARGGYVLQLGKNATTATAGVDSFFTPSDAGLGVSTNHVVEIINGRFSVFNKSLTRLQTLTDSNFWFRAGITVPSGWGFSDPRILFDTPSQRWFVSSVDVNDANDANRFLLAISGTADPTGTWHGVAFTADPVNGYWADFPTLGIDANAVYLSGDMFDRFGDAIGPALACIPKTDLLLTTPSVAGRTSFGVLDYSRYGEILQPVVTVGAASSPEAVLAVGDLGFDYLTHSTLVGTVVQNGASEGGATLSSPTTISIPGYSIPINPLQLGGITNNIDDGDARISAMVYRVGDVIYATHGTQINGRAAIQWFKIGAPSMNLIATGTITDPALDLFYPSIAANGGGTVALAFNASSATSAVSSYAVLGEPVNGTLSFGNLALLKAGVAAYRTNEDDSRWGDYSAITVDPANPTHFWALTMYPSSKSAWSTQITELIAAPLVLAMSASRTNVTLSWPAAAGGYQLQFTPKLSSPNWMPVTTQTLTPTNNQYVVSLSVTNGAQFFRLAK